MLSDRLIAVRKNVPARLLKVCNGFEMSSYWYFMCVFKLPFRLCLIKKIYFTTRSMAMVPFEVWNAAKWNCHINLLPHAVRACSADTTPTCLIVWRCWIQYLSDVNVSRLLNCYHHSEGSRCLHSTATPSKKYCSWTHSTRSTILRNVGS